MRTRIKKNTKRVGWARWTGATLILTGALVLSGCHTDMWVQPKVKAYYESDFFADRQASRPQVPGTVSQTGLRLDDAYYTGYVNGTVVAKIPAKAVQSFNNPVPGVEVKDAARNTPAGRMLERGQSRYNVYCYPCHGRAGDGNGMITQRGKGYWQKLPASYHTDYLRKIGDGHIYDVITNGKGIMYGYASRIQDVNDRWAIVAYVRALQASRTQSANSIPADQRERLQSESAADSQSMTSGSGMGTQNSASIETGSSGSNNVKTDKQTQKGGARGNAPKASEGSAPGANNGQTTTGYGGGER